MHRLVIAGLLAGCVLCPAMVAALQPSLVADINDVGAAASSSPDGFVTMGNQVLFTASDLASGRELWRTDGTQPGTFRLVDACPGECSGDARTVGTSPEGYFFEAFDEAHHTHLWFTRGTVSSTVALKSGLVIHHRGTWIPTTRLLVFFADDRVHGFEPWVSDGTSAGTRLLADLEPGPGSFLLGSELLFGGQLLFVGFDSVRGPALWRTGGRPHGTQPVKSWGPTTVRDLHGLGMMGTRAAFLSNGPGSALELWRSDGTPDGTTRIASLGRAVGLKAEGSDPRYLFFRTDAVSGTELWATDGTSKGTRALTFFKPPLPFPTNTLVPLGARLLFLADDGKRGYQPWVTDGTPKGTRLYADVCGGKPCGMLLLGAVNGRALLNVVTATGDNELYGTDGTAAGTGRLADICPGTCGSNPRLLAVVDQRALILGFPNLKAELWITNGTPAGTSLLHRFERAGTTSPPISHAVVGGRVYFTASDEPGNLEPWRTDGTVAGTEQLAEIASGFSLGSHPVHLQAAGSRVFFFADDGQHGYELWTSDGTAAGTTLVRDEQPGTDPFLAQTASPARHSGTICSTARCHRARPARSGAPTGRRPAPRSSRRTVCWCCKTRLRQGHKLSFTLTTPCTARSYGPPMAPPRERGSWLISNPVPLDRTHRSSSYSKGACSSGR